MSRPIFIVGCPRSGTSLLRNLLRSHPHLAFPRESHFIPGFSRAYGDPGDEHAAIDLARRVLSLSWIDRWELDLTPEAFASCRSFRAVVSTLFEAWAVREGKPRWGDKTPHYVTEIPTLMRLFPEGQVIHVVRDGRDVAASWVRTRLHPANLYTAATLWRAWVRAGRHAGAALPGDAYTEVSYERLVGDTRATMEAVCAVLGEPFRDAVLVPTPLPQGPRIRALTVSTHAVVPGNVEKWRTRLSARDRALFVAVAGDLLAELGYDVTDTPRHVGAAERALWTGHHAAVRTGRRLASALTPAGARTGLEFLRAGLVAAPSRVRRRRVR
jgi:hypothetical protein